MSQENQVNFFQNMLKRNERTNYAEQIFVMVFIAIIILQFCYYKYQVTT